MNTEICRRCRKPIRYMIQRNVLPDGGVMHNDCFRDYEQQADRINQFVKSCDKITSVRVSMPVDEMREDGKLNDPEQFSDERFYTYIRDKMTASNATESSLMVTLTFGGKSTGHKAGIVVKKNGELFSYRYYGAFGYMAPVFKDRRTRWMAYLKYVIDPKFASYVHGLIRELLWKSSPK